MNNLLKANFSRLFHDKLFKIFTAVMFLAGTALPLIYYVKSGSADAFFIDLSLFTYIFIVAVLLSVFTALFIGNEYSCGTLRNKITAGHRRESIYFANLLTSSAAGIIFCLAYIVPHMALGLLLSGRLEASPAKIAAYIALSFALTVVFSSVFTVIAMLCQSKAHTVAACILTVFALLFLGVYITSALNEPEILPGYSYTENGVTYEEEATENPNYISGTKRQVYEFLEDFTPGNQALGIANINVSSPLRLFAYDVLIIALTSLFGTVFFKRKDLK